jgi:hypothetical protein
MRNGITLIVTIVPIACAIGCATQRMVTHIRSEPAGARIEVNESYVGEAPVDVTLPQSGQHHRLKAHVMIRALAAEAGQYEQEKHYYYNQWAPENVLFDMSRKPPISKQPPEGDRK